MKTSVRKLLLIIVFFLFTFFCMSINVNASEIVNILAVSFCQREEVAKVIKLLILFMNIIRVLVPIALIIVAMIKLAGAVTSGDGIDSVKKKVIGNVIAAVLIFLIPSFVSIITKITNTYDSIQNCIKLTDSPIKTKPSDDIIGGGGGESEDNGAPTIKSITHKASFVTVKAQKGTKGSIAGYYFSTSSKTPNGKEDNWVKKSNNTLEIAKLPGTYYVFVKDTANNISKPTKLTITWEELYNDGPRSRDDKNFPAIVGNLDEVLKSKGDSLENLNDFIAYSVRSAGLFTKEGVATAGISAQNYLHAKYNLHISYISNIYCYGQRYNVLFGANATWGKVITLSSIDSSKRAEAQSQGIKKFCMGYYGGVDCQSFFGWAVHNGGFKAEKTHGSYTGKTGSKETSCGSNCSKSQMIELHKNLVIGDELVNPHHVMLFLATYDENHDGKHDGVYIYESYTRVGMKKWTNEELYKEGYFTINQMAGYYNNSSNYACLLDNKGNTVSIPDAWKDKASLFRSNCSASN